MKNHFEILDFIFTRHDVICNQKYDTRLPYSFHLNSVMCQVDRFLTTSFSENLRDIHPNLKIAAAGHDLIEDARMTYHDIKNITNKEVADIIYACTDEKGKSRKERHSQRFFDELKQNRLAVYVKLCDIIANVLYSKLTNSSMFDKYKEEYPNLKGHLYIKDEYEVLWNSLHKELFD